MGFWKTLNKIANTTDRVLHKVEFNSKDHFDSPFETDTVYTIMTLRNENHDKDIEIMKLRFELMDNENARNKNPAVKDAWDKYQMLLKLAKE